MATRPGSRTSQRPSSALSNSTPFTPRHSKSSAAARLGGLSSKQVDKISTAIASINHGNQGNYGDNNVPRERQVEAQQHLVHPNGSFITSSAFADAPLNSRVPSISPRQLSQSRLRYQQQLNQVINDSINAGDDDGDDGYHGNDDSFASDEQVGFTNQAEETLFTDSLKDVPIDIQESLLVEDLLSVLIGIEGTYIRFAPEYTPDDSYESMQGAKFSLHPDLDPSLQDMTSRILPLASYYTAIDTFIEKYSHLTYGLVFHALCAVFRSKLRDYLVLIAQLEHQFNTSPNFTLQRLWFYVYPTLHTFSLIHILIHRLAPSSSDQSDVSDNEGRDGVDSNDDPDDDDSEDDEAVRAVKADMRRAAQGTKFSSLNNTNNLPIKGGEILAILYELGERYTGDPVASKLYFDLLLRASQPYAQILLRWIRTGCLEDPYEEFMVKQSKSIERGNLETDYIDEVWEKMYTLRDDDAIGNDRKPELAGLTPRQRGLGGGSVIPPFLEAWKVKILLAGKYLNVIRECGTEINVPQENLGRDNTNESVEQQHQSGDNDIVKNEEGGAVEVYEEERKEELEKEKDKDKEKGKVDSEYGLVADTSTSVLDFDSQELIDMTDEKFQRQLEQAYTYSNRTLLDLLIKEQALIPRLRSLKHQFFMDQGDSFTHFLDLAEYELSKKARSVSLTKLQSLLDLAIRNPSSASGSDPYKEDVKVALSNTSLIDWLMRIVNVSGVLGNEENPGVGGNLEGFMEGAGSESSSTTKKSDEHPLSGIEAFTLDYAVSFPLSLVLSRKTILRYQLIFRHLLSLKNLDQALTKTWLEHTKSPVWRKSSGYAKLEQWKVRVFTLRARMLSYVQHMYAFAVNEVLEPNWTKLVNKIEKCQTVDELLRDHVDFLDTCLKECMLTNAKLLKLHSKIMTACSLFASYTSQFSKLMSQATATFQLSEGDPSRMKLDKQIAFLQRFEHNFNHYSNLHTQTVTYFASTETIALLALVVRLGSVRVSAPSNRDQSNPSRNSTPSLN